MKPLRQLKVLIYSLRLIGRAAPKETTFLFLCLIVQGLIPALALLVIRDSIHLLAHLSNIATFPWQLFVLWGVVLLSETVFEPILSFIRLRLNEKVLAHFNILLMKKANSLAGLDFLEDRQSASELKELKDQIRSRPLNLIYILTGLFRESISLFSIFLLLSTVVWWLPVLVFISAIPHTISTIWREKQAWDIALFRSPETQKMAALSQQSLDLRSAKEIRLFGFGDFLIKKYQAIFHDFQKEMNQERRTLFSRFVLLSFPSILGDFLTFYLVISCALAGQFKSSEVVMALQGLMTTQKMIGFLTQHLGMFAQTFSFFEKFHDFVKNAKSRIRLARAPRILSSLKGRISFRNVSFSYLKEQKVLQGIDLNLKAGETVAIVGENGAGKSTLVKLLCRFYDPTDGSIAIDDMDLKELDLSWWRSNLSCVMQDFAKYPLTVRENIGIGDWHQLNDSVRIKEAAFKGGIHTIKLPNGHDTFLGKSFGGTSLSGGEWQKIALARAFMRRSKLLILDEPTSSLDARSEREVFHSFSELARDQTAILITHRLGSISMADRILVMKQGAIIEEGTHDTLLRQGGEYATLYEMQAANYQKTSPLG